MVNKQESNHCPEDWTSAEFKDLVELQRGFDLPVGKRRHGKYPLITSNGATDFHDEYMVEGPGVVTGRSGTIGKVHYVEDNYWPLNTTLFAKHMHGNEPKYVYYFLESFRLERFGTGTGVPTLNRNVVHAKTVAIPPIHEQRKIAAILKSVDGAISATQRIIDQTEVVKRGLMQQLLTKGIGHTKFKQTEIGDIPTGWQVLTLGEMLEKGMILGHQDGNHGELYPRSEEFTAEGVPYLAANCITDGQVDLSLAKFLPMERASKFKKGVAKNQDVLFAHNATVGPVSVLKTDLDFVILSTTLTYYRCNMAFINPYYLSQFMTSPMFVGQYTRVMGQTTRNQVPLTLQRKFFHVIPPIGEQMRITEVLSSVDNKLQGEKSKLSILLDVKQGIMQVLLTGKTRVNVDEPSEVSV